MKFIKNYFKYIWRKYIHYNRNSVGSKIWKKLSIELQDSYCICRISRDCFWSQNFPRVDIRTVEYSYSTKLEVPLMLPISIIYGQQLFLLR